MRSLIMDVVKRLIIYMVAKEKSIYKAQYKNSRK